jgi:hypothetical protein
MWGWNSHSQKWELWVLLDSQKLRARVQESKHLALGVLYTIGKVLKCRCLKWPRMSHLENLQHKLWSKEGPRVKLAVWFPTTKSRESIRSRCVQVKCDMPLESLWRKLELWFRPRPDLSSGREVMDAQSPGSPNRESFGTPPWESREKVPFGCSLHAKLQKIL